MAKSKKLDGATTEVVNDVNLVADALVAELDSLVKELDGYAKLTKETARDIGLKLAEVKKRDYDADSQKKAFRLWFEARYHRTFQVASRWMRLGAHWKACVAAHAAEPNHPKKQPWDRLTIVQALTYAPKDGPGRKPQTPAEKEEAEKKKLAADLDAAREFLAKHEPPCKTFKVKPGSKVTVDGITIELTEAIVIQPE